MEANARAALMARGSLAGRADMLHAEARLWMNWLALP